MSQNSASWTLLSRDTVDGFFAKKGDHLQAFSAKKMLSVQYRGQCKYKLERTAEPGICLQTDYRFNLYLTGMLTLANAVLYVTKTV